MLAIDRQRLLVEWALEEGFDRAGVTPLEPSDHAAALRSWLDRGDHAEMSWMGRRLEARLDPRTLLEGARSALCVALQYHPAKGHEPCGDLWPRVARYARGEDYHFIMQEGLKRLGERVEAAFPGSRSRHYVDTGPLLERELAARAGLGSIGKNTHLLHPEGGSWFFLGELLLTLDVQTETRYEDLCGSCTACLDACPTGALPEPYRLDSRRCISYWTIEHRGPVPEAMREQLGGWVFGCDICQEVCPLNEAPAAVTEERLELPRHREALDLEALADLSRQQYVERFRHSAMKRAKLPGLKRNVALAMGYRAEEKYVPALARLLDNENPTVRSHAAWSLGRIGGEPSAEVLRNVATSEADAAPKEEILRALARVCGRRIP